MQNLVNIFLNSVFVGNILLAYFLGMCSFLAVSKNMQTAIVLGFSLVFVLAITGAVAMLWDTEMGMPWPRDESDWLAASSGFAFAFGNVMVRKMPDVSMQTKSAASWLGVVLVAGCWIVLVSEPLPRVELSTWTGALLLGWFGFVVMTLAVIFGVSRMPVHRSAVILLFELVVGAVSSLLLTDERVLMQEWLGGALILVAAYFAAHAHVKEHA